MVEIFNRDKWNSRVSETIFHLFSTGIEYLKMETVLEDEIILEGSWSIRLGVEGRVSQHVIGMRGTWSNSGRH